MHSNGGMGEPITNKPPVNGGQAAILNVLNSLDDKVKDMYNDEDTFASFVFYCLSTTIKKGTWRVGQNKKLVSHLFTPYDEALALLILENNCDGIKEIVANIDSTYKKRKIKTKYTCKGSFKKGGDFKKADGGQGWTKEGLRRFVELTRIVEESRATNGRCKTIELKIKDSYIIKRSSDMGQNDNIDEDHGEDGNESDSEPVYVCTGIPI
jgi:hypothetical protein